MNHRRLKIHFPLLLAAALLSPVGLGADTPSIASLSAIPSAFERQQHMMSLARQANARSLSELFQKAQELPMPLRRDASLRLLERWVPIAPKAAARACMETGTVNLRQIYLEHCGNLWGNADPKAALAFAQTMPPGPLSRNFLIGLFGGYAEKDPPAAYALLQQFNADHPSYYYGTPILTRIVRAWCLSDPQAALRQVLWAGKHLRHTSGLYSVVDEWIKEDFPSLERALRQCDAEQRSRLSAAIYNNDNIQFSHLPFLLRLLAQGENERVNTPYRAGEIFRTLAGKDPARAWNEATALKNRAWRAQAIRATLTKWMEQDEKTASETLMALEDEGIRDGAIADLCQSFSSKKKYDAFLKWLPLIVGKRNMDNAITQYIRDGGDPARLLDAIPGGNGRDRLLQSTLQYAWNLPKTKDAREKFRTWLLELPPGKKRAEMIGALSTEKDFRGFSENVDWILGHLTPMEQDYALRRMWDMQEQTGKANLNFFEKLPEGHLKDDLIGRTAAALAEKDPAGAVQWLNSLQPSAKQIQAYGEMLNVLSHTQPKAALELLGMLPEEHLPERWQLQSLTNNLACEDRQAVLDWSLSLQNPESRAMALEGVLSQWAKTDAPAAFAFLEALNKDQQKGNLITSSNMAYAWAQSDPKAMSQWIDSRTDSITACQSVGPLIDTWLRLDPMTATQWMTTLPQNEARWSAIEALARSQESTKSPDAVFEWIASVPQSQQTKLGFTVTQADFLQSFLYQVKQSNPQAAQSYLDRSNVTPQERENLQKMLDR